MTKRVYDPFKKAAAEVEAKQALTPPPVPASGVDLKDLLDKTRTLLYREISQLMIESSGGLLCKDSSQALVNYIKLLKDLIKDENELVDNLSDEELDKIIRERK